MKITNSFLSILAGYRLNLVEMEKSEKVPELKEFSTTNKSETPPFPPQFLTPEVTVNQIFHANPHPDRFMAACCMDAEYFCQNRSHRVGQVSQEFRTQAAPDALHQHVEPVQRREPEDRGATPAWMNLHHRPRPAETREGDTRRDCCCGDCRPNRGGKTELANRDTTR